MRPYDHPHYYHLEQEARRRVRHRHARPERRQRRLSFAVLKSMTSRLPLLRRPVLSESEAPRLLAPEQ